MAEQIQKETIETQIKLLKNKRMNKKEYNKTMEDFFNNYKGMRTDAKQPGWNNPWSKNWESEGINENLSKNTSGAVVQVSSEAVKGQGPDTKANSTVIVDIGKGVPVVATRKIKRDKSNSAPFKVISETKSSFLNYDDSQKFKQLIKARDTLGKNGNTDEYYAEIDKILGKK